MGKIDSAGILLEDVEVISSDGVVTLRLAKGTRAIDESGKPLDSITVTAEEPKVLPTGYYIYLWAYNFSPNGASFDTLSELIVYYDPSLIDWEGDEFQPQFGYFNEEELTWDPVDTTADFDTRCVTTQIDRLGTYVLAFRGWGDEAPIS